MSINKDLDIDLQELKRVFTHGDGHSLLQSDAESDDWADNAEDVLSALLKLGWMPPTYMAQVKAQVKKAWEAVEDDAAFVALQGAATLLDVELVDPFADALVCAELQLA